MVFLLPWPTFEKLHKTFVFLKINHTHESPEGTMHEFQKTPVKVLHTDKYYAVLARSIQLDLLENYALDQAYKLNLALKQAAGGGGGAHAGHNHAPWLEPCDSNYLSNGNHPEILHFSLCL